MARELWLRGVYVPPPSFHTDRVRQFPDGQIFDVITHGVRNMPSYASQVPGGGPLGDCMLYQSAPTQPERHYNDVPVELRVQYQVGYEYKR